MSDICSKMQSNVINCNYANQLVGEHAKFTPILDKSLAVMRIILTVMLLFFAYMGEVKAQEEAGLVEVGQWQLGLTLGVGHRAAVVTGEDSQSTFVLPSVQYYGERVFFDNGTLGYTLLEQESLVLSLITEFNPMAAWFYRDHPDNWFSQQAFSDSTIDSVQMDLGGKVTEGTPVDADNLDPTGPEFSDDVREEVDIPLTQLEKPSWSVDAGAQLNWFFNRKSGLGVQYFFDASLLHKGQRLELNWFYRDRLESGYQWQFELGTSYLDKAASDYYFGVRRGQHKLYQAGASFIPYASATLIKNLNANWSLIGHLYYQGLSDEISNSPKINTSTRLTYMLGVRYGF